MDHDVLLGLPLAGQADKEELRAFLVHRVPYTLDDDENPSDLDVLVDGAIPNVLGWNRTWFWYDPLGGITEVDNVTVIQTNDGYIYKANGIDLDIESVLDRDLTEPPATGLGVGDCYIVATGATGDWAGYDDYKALYTERGWVMIAPKIGNWILVEDEDGFVRYTEDGLWILGPGQRAFEDESIPVSAFINVGRTSFIVENQTTNTPPASPLKGVAYVIGGSPTGVWSGKSLQLAVCEDDGVWTYYVPANGWQVFDKALNAPYRYNGSAWLSGAGVWLGYSATIHHASGTQTNAGGGAYTYSDSVAPTASVSGCKDDGTIITSYTAKRVTAPLRFIWDGTFTGDVSSGYSIGLFRDSEANAIDWLPCQTDASGRPSGHYQFTVTAADVIAHTYFIRVVIPAGKSNVVFGRRVLTLEEGA